MSVRQRVAREFVARRGWTGMTAAFAVDRDHARREPRASVRASGEDFDSVLAGAAGDVLGRPVRTMVWSERQGAFGWWRYDARRRKREPDGREGVAARKLRVELSDGHEGCSVEKVLAGRLSRSWRDALWFSIAGTTTVLEAVHARWEREVQARHRAERRGDHEGAALARRRARALARTMKQLERRLARKGVSL